MRMGRDEPLDSANSEFYFMLAAARDMGHAYTVVGRVVAGMGVLLALKQREPPANPDIMQSVHLLADLPMASNMTDTALSAFIDKVRHEKAAEFNVCDVMVPVKIE